MKDVEELLKKAPFPDPPTTLDRRVETSVSDAERRRAARRPAMVPLWAFAAGCLACTLIGFLLHPLAERPRLPSPAGASVVTFIVEPDRPDLRILGTNPDRQRRPFWQRERGELKPLVRDN